MKTAKVRAALLAFAAVCTIFISAMCRADDAIKVKGVIVGRDGAAMNVNKPVGRFCWTKAQRWKLRRAWSACGRTRSP